MKIKKNLILRHVADTWIVLPVGEETANFNGMLSLNETGAKMWKLLEEGKSKMDLINTLTTEFDVSVQVALHDVDEFLVKLEKANCFEVL